MVAGVPVIEGGLTVLSFAVGGAELEVEPVSVEPVLVELVDDAVYGFVDSPSPPQPETTTASVAHRKKRASSAASQR